MADALGRALADPHHDHQRGVERERDRRRENADGLHGFSPRCRRRGFALFRTVLHGCLFDVFPTGGESDSKLCRTAQQLSAPAGRFRAISGKAHFGLGGRGASCIGRDGPYISPQLPGARAVLVCLAIFQT